MMCRDIQNGLPSREEAGQDPKWAEVVRNRQVRLATPPALLNLSYDRTCNLSCPTCRTDTFIAKGKERDKYFALTENVVLPLLRTAELTFVTGSGDPFVSRVYRHVLKTVADHPHEFPHLKFNLMTNGLLLTRAEWDRYEGLAGRINQINISVDAATPETYRIVRRGGEFSELLPNLHFAGELVRSGAINNLILNFVVQSTNFREMPAFVDLAHAVGATRVIFQRLTNWGTFSPEIYASQCVFHASHPKYSDFLAVLSDPRLRDPIVDQGMAALAAVGKGEARLLNS
jgi:MoaA/NifB/PqqE/SkfB family radical SAM enzyme